MGSFGLCGCVCVCTSSTQHNTWLHIDWFLPFFFLFLRVNSKAKKVGKRKTALMFYHPISLQNREEHKQEANEEMRLEQKKYERLSCRRQKRKVSLRGFMTRGATENSLLKAFWDYLNVLVTLSFKKKSTWSHWTSRAVQAEQKTVLIHLFTLI